MFAMLGKDVSAPNSARDIGSPSSRLPTPLL